MPYVPYQGNGMTIAQLMRAAGENRAQGLRRSGEISQQGAANLGNVVSQGAMTIGQMIRDEPIRKQKEVDAARQAEIDALALRKGEQDIRVNEGRIAAQEQAAAEAAEQQRGRSVERGLMPLAMTEGPDGVPTYDRALLTKEFTTAGLADRLPEVFKSLDETEKAALGLKAARQEFAQKGIISLLRGVEAAGDTPSALKNAAQLGVAQGFFTQEEAGQYLARATDPASVRAIRMALSGQVSKPVEVSANASLMTEDGKVLGTAPGPAPTKANPTEASLAAAAAAGDPQAASALAILRRQNAPQGGGSGGAVSLQSKEVVDDTGKTVTANFNPHTGAYTKADGSVIKNPRPSAGTQKAATGQQKKVLGFFNRMLEAERNARAAEEQVGGRDFAAEWLPGEALENAVRSGPGQQYTQAQRTFTEGRLRKESGAAIPTAEYDMDRTTNFKRPNDTAENVAAKRKARLEILRGAANEAGSALAEFYGPDATVESVLSEFEDAGSKGGTAEGETQPIPGYPGTEQTYRNGKWIRTK